MNNFPDTPNPDNYWVIPGRLIAGAYPGARYFEEDARRKLDRLLMAGVTQFVDLTEEGELPPYLAILEEQAGWLDKTAVHQRFPIKDMHCPTPAQVKEILDTIDAALKDRRTVYVHCYGGIGRTGTIIGCYLVRHGLPGAEALNTIARLRAGSSNGWVRSPETDEQWEMVLNWESGK